MTQRKIFAAPSILSANFGKLAEAVSFIETTGADWIHCDIMDGHFVPNLTFGPKTVADLRPITKLPLDCHLMVTNPEDYIDIFAKAGADYFTFHVEATKNKSGIIRRIREAGMKPGISLVPDTPVEKIKEFAEEVDLILVMLVNPGFGGQRQIPECLEKVQTLASLKKEKAYNYLISVDGGVTTDNAHIVIEKGVDVIVAGSAFFAAEDKAQAVKMLKGEID